MTVVCKLLQIYKLSTFIITMLDAFYQSLVCFFVPYLVSTGVIHILSLQSSVKNKKKKKKEKLSSEKSRFIAVYLPVF